MRNWTALNHQLAPPYPIPLAPFTLPIWYLSQWHVPRPTPSIVPSAVHLSQNMGTAPPRLEGGAGGGHWLEGEEFGMDCHPVGLTGPVGTPSLGCELPSPLPPPLTDLSTVRRLFPNSKLGELRAKNGRRVEVHSGEHHGWQLVHLWILRYVKVKDLVPCLWARWSNLTVGICRLGMLAFYPGSQFFFLNKPKFYFLSEQDSWTHGLQPSSRHKAERKMGVSVNNGHSWIVLWWRVRHTLLLNIVTYTKQEWRGKETTNTKPKTQRTAEKVSPRNVKSPPRHHFILFFSFLSFYYCQPASKVSTKGHHHLLNPIFPLFPFLRETISLLEFCHPIPIHNFPFNAITLPFFPIPNRLVSLN